MPKVTAAEVKAWRSREVRRFGRQSQGPKMEMTSVALRKPAWSPFGGELIHELPSTMLTLVPVKYPIETRGQGRGHIGDNLIMIVFQTWIDWKMDYLDKATLKMSRLSCHHYADWVPKVRKSNRVIEIKKVTFLLIRVCNLDIYGYHTWKALYVRLRSLGFALKAMGNNWRILNRKTREAVLNFIELIVAAAWRRIGELRGGDGKSRGREPSKKLLT